MRLSLQDLYVYGLWQRDIESQLAWRVDTPRNSSSEPRRLPINIAPCWSWASLHDCAINTERDVLRDETSILISHIKAFWLPNQSTTADLMPNWDIPALAFRCALLPVKFTRLLRDFSSIYYASTRARRHQPN